jgi:hypothetical protein
MHALSCLIAIHLVVMDRSTGRHHTPPTRCCTRPQPTWAYQRPLSRSSPNVRNLESMWLQRQGQWLVNCPGRANQQSSGISVRRRALVLTSRPLLATLHPRLHSPPRPTSPCQRPRRPRPLRNMPRSPRPRRHRPTPTLPRRPLRRIGLRMPWSLRPSTPHRRGRLNTTASTTAMPRAALTQRHPCRRSVGTLTPRR